MRVSQLHERTHARSVVGSGGGQGQELSVAATLIWVATTNRCFFSPSDFRLSSPLPSLLSLACWPADFFQKTGILTRRALSTWHGSIGDFKKGFELVRTRLFISGASLSL